MDIEKYNKIIIDISTKVGKTIGFYLKSENIIVTKSQMISGTKEAYISSIEGKEHLANVLYIDEIYNIAFLEVPENNDFIEVKLAEQNIEKGQKIVAIKKIEDFKLDANNGIILKTNELINKIKYAQTDIDFFEDNNKAIIFFNNKNEIVGLNANILSNQNSLDLILPINYLKEAIGEYRKFDGEFIIKCRYCYNLLTIRDINNDYCSYCGEKITKELNIEDDNILSLVEKKIDNIIKSLRPNAKILNLSENLWAIKEGTAKIKINYNPSTKYLVLYSTLCKMPKENIGEFYEFLLSENSKLKNLSFSVKEKEVILSTMYILFDENIQQDIYYEIFKQLFEKSDYYDSILIEMGGK